MTRLPQPEPPKPGSGSSLPRNALPLPTPGIIPARRGRRRPRPGASDAKSKWLGYALYTVATAGSVVVSIYYFNRFVAAEQAIEASRAQIDRELQRRSDLIRNLVPSVFEYADLERNIFTEVAKVRKDLVGKPPIAPAVPGATAPVAAQAPAGLGAPADKLGELFGRLLALSEQYPDMKASAPFELLMQKLTESEDRLAAERQKYNELVYTYQTLASSFPGAAFARVFGFEKRKPLFAVDPDSSFLPRVRRPAPEQ